MSADIRISDRMFCASAIDRDGELELTIEHSENSEPDYYVWLTPREVDALYDVLTLVRLNRQTVERM